MRCCVNTVAKLMRQAQIMPKMIRRFRATTNSRNTKASPNLVGRVFQMDRANACWVSDITYIPTREGWLYLAGVLDLYSRAVVGWAMSKTLDTQLATDALNMAIRRRAVSPAILHSDQGSTYATAEYRTLLSRHGIRQSMSRKGDCWDTQYTMKVDDRPSLTRAGIGQRALALTCRLRPGVPRALPGRSSVT
jgi:putative transposase